MYDILSHSNLHTTYSIDWQGYASGIVRRYAVKNGWGSPGLNITLNLNSCSLFTVVRL